MFRTLVSARIRQEKTALRYNLTVLKLKIVNSPIMYIIYIEYIHCVVHFTRVGTTEYFYSQNQGFISPLK